MMVDVDRANRRTRHYGVPLGSTTRFKAAVVCDIIASHSGTGIYFASIHGILSTDMPAFDPNCPGELREIKNIVFNSWHDIWISLDEVLDVVASELETVSAEKKNEYLRLTSRWNDGLAHQIRTRAV